MAWSFKYTSLPQLINDLQTFPKGVWNSYGRIDSLEIIKSTNHVVMYSLSYGTQIKNLSRYVFTLEEFLNLEFSKELPGLNLYVSEDKTRLPDSWNSLPSEAKELYQKTANRLLSENRLKIYWPPPRLVVDTPILEVKIGALQLTNGTSFNFTPGAPQEFGESKSVILRVTNRGPGTLRFTGVPKINIVNDDTYNNFLFGSVLDKDFLTKDTSVEIEVVFSAQTMGNKRAVLSFATNDPAVPLFSVVLLGEASDSSFDRGPDVIFYDSLVFEKGDIVSGVEFRVKTIKTYSPISGISFYDGIDFLGEVSGYNPEGGDEIFFYEPLLPIVSDKIFTVKVTDGIYQGTADRELLFMNKVYYGYSEVSGGYGSEDIIFLQNNKFSDVASGDVAFGVNDIASGGSGAYVLYAYPSRLGSFYNAQDLNSGFVYSPNSFVISEMLFENSSGYKEMYTIVRSDNKTFASDLKWRINIASNI
jgi:hypothetical protein